MVDIGRMKVRWEGIAGGPGVSTFYSTSPATDLAALVAFFTGIKQFVPLACTFQVENGGDMIDPATGTLTGAWGVGTATAVGATSAGTYSAPTGFLVVWDTGTIVNGHRLRGKTFIVPGAGASFTTAGQVVAATRTNINAECATYVTNTAGAVVWNRPKPGQAGGFSQILTGTTSGKAAILRSRRD